MYRELTISSIVPATKLRKAVKTGKLFLTKAELAGCGSVIHLHPESYVKALKAKKAGRGVRLEITKHEIKKSYKKAQGGSVWGEIWNGIKTGFKALKDSGLLSKAVDAAVPALATYAGAPQAAIPARAAIRSLSGVGLDEDSDDEGGRITFNDVKTRGKQALRYMKDRGIATDLVDLAEKKLIEKATKPEHVDLIKTVRRTVKQRYGVGIPKQYKKFVKGSQEAKDHMAKIRAMKGKKKQSGGSFKMSGGDMRAGSFRL